MQKQTFVADIWGMISPILLYYILSFILQLVLCGIVPGFLLEENAMWLLTAINVLMLPVFYRMYDRDRLWRVGERDRRTGLGFSDLVWVVLGSVCISRGVNLLLGLTPLPYLFPEYETVSETIYGCSLLSQIAASVISAPIQEEVLIRGLFYSRMKLATKNVKLSMIASAFVFGIFHGNVVQGVYAVLLGLFFVQVYETYQSLGMAVLAHMAANATSILLEQFTWLNEITGNPVVYYLQTAIFLTAGWLCWKKIKLFSSKRS